MSRIEKLVERLLSEPKDFEWDEAVKLLDHFGYYELPNGKTGGSRRKFADRHKSLICFHKPHPGNIMKEYAVKYLIAHLKQKKLINDD
ncbi:type II toxin-antitoxin system HicA family toxin [Filimonas effusa]|uniref:Type II toxin-antitoxin system HicA family toxin n=1 Tax=Filimonas effusa TaxID=2508721 RepID=A0A4Q1D3T3_9BACT|nr:type II toxin-antitoxin system HicA family toxin [Filimonas effusa]RXK83055.1 type II toxin-antitoxin system HicA family toxin [Filimonas effusa]